MGRLPDIPEDSALARLFADPDVQDATAWFSLPGGSFLYRSGEPAQRLYLLRAGRLGVLRPDETEERQLLGVIRPGEPAGEMALLSGTPHTADVVALRDCEVFAIERDDFLAAADRLPDVMAELARLMVLRLRSSPQSRPVGAPSVYGFISMGQPPALRPFVEKVCQALKAMGFSAVVVGSEAAHAATEWFSRVEHDHNYVLYAAEAHELSWRAVVSRQVDRLFRIIPADAPAPRINPNAALAAPGNLQALADLVIMHPPDARFPRGSGTWTAAFNPARVLHIRQGDPAGVARLARLMAGQSVGLVLSGGGARAYAHVGAIRALRARDIPIDFVAGASMGAVIAAGLAMGWDDVELDARIRRAFVDTSPLDDIAFPILAMTRGEKVSTRLAEHFGDTDISDLWLPFFCVSSNLTTGNCHVHRRGSLARALRASISLPGVLPPVTDRNDVLVDGAVLKNFPSDVMRSLQPGPVIGVDVSRGRSINADDVARPHSIWRWIASGDWRKGPPIVSLLMRAATVTTGRDLQASREATDLLVTPDVSGVEIRDWDAYAPAVEAGYTAMENALNTLSGPVQTLRRQGRDALSLHGAGEE